MPLGKRLWVYFSGHGANLVRPGERVVPVLLTADARQSDAQHVAGELWALWTARSCMFEELVVIFDACGVVVPNVPIVDPPGSPNFASRCVVFHATSAKSPIAWEVAQPDGHPGGRFTSLILKSLREPPRPVTALDLYTSLSTALGEAFTFTPTPVSAGSIVLVPAPGRRSAAPPADAAAQERAMPREVLRAPRSAPLSLRRATALALAVSYGTRLDRGDVVVAVWGAAASGAPLRGWAIVDVTGRMVRRLDDPGPNGAFAVRVRAPGGLLLAVGTTDAGVVESTALRVLRPRGDDPVMIVVDLADGADPTRALCEGCLFTKGVVAPEKRVALEHLASLEPESGLSPELTSSRLREDLIVLGADPVACLLVAALARRSGLDDLQAEALARSGLPSDDPDVAALSGGRSGDGLPRLAASWSARIEALAEGVRKGEGDRLTVAERTVAGRRVPCLPWLTWFGESGSTPWEVWAANLQWPGWDNGRWKEPVPAPRPVDPSEVTRVLESAPADLRDSLYKRPPVGAMVAAERIVFVGATNDQLAPAIVSAFLLRERRPWDELELIFLDDAPLSTIVSNGRTGAALLRDRDAACDLLEGLLPHVARSWVLWRSPERYPDDTFASLWDLQDDAKAWVHVSRYDGKDLRTSPGKNVTIAQERAFIDDWRARVETIRKRCRRIAGL